MNPAPGVVHLGLGAFHRAHQALVFDHLLRAGDDRWGVFGVAMHSPDTVAALQAQQHRYSVCIADATQKRWQWVHAVQGSAVAAHERARVVQALGAAHTRWITLSVTEKGYGAAVVDLLLDGLALRQQRGLAGVTVASCDNLSGNGRHLRALCLHAAKQRDPLLGDWVARQCRFPNSMVDRIVPQATDAVRAEAAQALGVADSAALATEAFWEWVIEDDLVDARDADVLRSAGVNVVADVAPFEEAKLRMLNASHTALAAMGAALGLGTISDCIEVANLRAFVWRLMSEEVAPHLQRPDWADYRDALLQRFANPALQHRVLQICNDSSQKIQVRWVPTIVAQRARRQSISHMAFAGAAWMRFLTGVDDQGASYTWSDPLRASLQASALAHTADPAAAVDALLLPSIWGEHLVHDPVWRQALIHARTRIRTLGLAAALKEHLS